MIFKIRAVLFNINLSSVDERVLFLKLRLNLQPLERGERLQAHFQNRRRLEIAQLEVLHQVRVRDLFVFGLADRRDHPIDRVERDHEPFQNMRAFLCFAKVELGAARDDRLPVLKIFRQNILQREQARLDAVHKRDHVEVEVLFEVGVLVEPVQHFLRSDVVLELDHNAHAVAVGLVAQVADAFDLFVLRELRDRADELGLIHLVRDLGDDDVELAAILLLHDLRLRARR